MEALQSLWDSGALGAMFTTFVTFAGQMSAINSQKFTIVLDALQKQQSSDISVHDAAMARTKDDGGTRTRRIMLFMSFFMLAICPFIFAFFDGIPIAEENATQSGGWLWSLIPEKESLGVEYIRGFYITEVWKELMANLISAYIGAGITRKAFALDK